MYTLYPLIAVLGESGSTIIDRMNFKRTRISPQQIMPVMFFSMSILLLAFILITHQPFPHYTLVSAGLMVLIILVSFVGNIFDYRSLKVDDLSLREPMADFEPIAGGLVGYILFASERKPSLLIAFLLGIIVVYWGTHRRKLRRVQKKGMWFMLLAVCFYGLLPSLYMLALDSIAPAYIMLVRVIAILMLSLAFFPQKHLRKLSPTKLRYGLLAGLSCSIGTVAGLYAISSIGVVLTAVLMMLGPAVRYCAGYFLLKEKVKNGQMASSLALAVIVLAAVAV